MFAVKGWSVDAAALKPQTEVYRSSKSRDDEPQKSGKKRKRAHAGEAKQDPNVRPDDVGRLWDQHLEGKGPTKSQKQRKRKKQKLESKGESNERLETSSTPKVKSGSQDRPEVATEQNATTKDTGERWEDIILDNKKAKQWDKERKREKWEQQQREAGKANGTTTDVVASSSKAVSSAAIPVPPQSSKLTPMQSAMRQKLVSARFRHLNQTLYTEPSGKAQELFTQNPEMFEDYHAGFRQQVSVWPENPLDNFVSTIRHRGKIRAPFRDKNRKGRDAPDLNTSSAALPRTHGTCILADLGCGDARLAQTFKDSGEMSGLNLKIHSYDLHSPSPLVTTADISNLPLADGSVDIALFCLALMGTNWISFIEEAYRILHWKGELWVAEIKSRFGRVSKAGKPVAHSIGSRRKQDIIKKAKEAAKLKEQVEVNEQEVLQTEVDGVVDPKSAETDVSAFVDVLKRRGFVLKSVDLGNKMFVKMEFVKAAAPTKGKGVQETDGKAGFKAKTKFLPDEEEDVATEDEAKVLKPCLYKIR